MKTSRRAFLRGGALFPAGLVATPVAAAQHEHHTPPAAKKTRVPEQRKAGPARHADHEPEAVAIGAVPFEMPDLPKLQIRGFLLMNGLHEMPELPEASVPRPGVEIRSAEMPGAVRASEPGGLEVRKERAQ